MNNFRHQWLWLMLPTVLVVAGFVIFQPGADQAPAITTAAQSSADSSPAKTGQPETEFAALGDVTSPESPSISDGEEVARDREFINYAFPLLSTWSLQELKPLLAEATIAASSDEQLTEVMSVLEDRLGELKSFETPQPVTLADAAPTPEPEQEGELQHYQFRAWYETGQAEVDLILHKRQEDSSLYSFNIHVPNEEQNFF